jgi:two-component sensor histidine kinase
LAGSTANFIALGIASVVFSASWKGGRLAGEGPRVRRKDRDVSGSLALAHRELVSRKLASFLHSSVQNRILALQLSQPQEPPESIHSLESAVIDIIDQAKHDFLVGQSLPISERLKSLQADWEGVARLEFSLPESDLTTSQAEVVVMLAEEAITNSIRHGLATEVSVSVSPGDFPNQIIFEVLDNGTGPLGKTKVGLGSSLLRELANDEWSLGFRDIGGARLFAKVIC